MAAVLSIVLPLAVLGYIVRLIIGSGPRPSRFSPRRASTRMRSTTGGNATAVLASIGVAQLGLQVLQINGSGTTSAEIGSVLVAAVMVAFVFALVVADKQAGFLLAVVGVAAGLATTILDLGPAGGAALLALSLPLVWLLGLGRGFFH